MFKDVYFQPPICEDGINIVRRKRQVIELDERNNVYGDIEENDNTIKVYSGLYVNEASDLDEDFDQSVAGPIVSINEIYKITSLLILFFLRKLRSMTPTLSASPNAASPSGSQLLV